MYPLLRIESCASVSEGTRVHVTVTNKTLLPAFVHGLHQHPGEQKDTITIPPNGSRDVAFLAGTPGLLAQMRSLVRWGTEEGPGVLFSTEETVPAADQHAEPGPSM